MRRYCNTARTRVVYYCYYYFLLWRYLTVLVLVMMPITCWRRHFLSWWDSTYSYFVMELISCLIEAAFMYISSAHMEIDELRCLKEHKVKLHCMALDTIYSTCPYLLVLLQWWVSRMIKGELLSALYMCLILSPFAHLEAPIPHTDSRRQSGPVPTSVSRR
jgi:hypothetical protein